MALHRTDGRKKALPHSASAHPGVKLDVGAVLRDQRAAVREVRDVGHPADAAGVVGGPVVEAPLVLVLQGRQLDCLDVQTGIYQLSDPSTHKSIGGFKKKFGYDDGRAVAFKKLFIFFWPLLASNVNLIIFKSRTAE